MRSSDSLLHPAQPTGKTWWEGHRILLDEKEVTRQEREGHRACETRGGCKECVRQGEAGRKGLHGGRACVPCRKVHTLSSEGKPRRFSKENERIIFLFLTLALLQCAG